MYLDLKTATSTQKLENKVFIMFFPKLKNLLFIIENCDFIWKYQQASGVDPKVLCNFGFN